jgi:hypothetical protein
MPPKADKLSQNLQSMQIFLERKLEQHREIEPIVRELKQLETILETKKLCLQIVSEKETLAQALFDFLSSQPNLTAAYQIKLDPLPDLPKQIAPEIQSHLTLTCELENAPLIEQSYILPSQGKIQIGRNTALQISLNHKNYRGISWDHAQILVDFDEKGQPYWEIEDLDSTNGTFVNGVLLVKPQILQAGDKITLANSNADETGIVKLIFDCQTLVPDTSINEPYLDIIDSDILLLVVDLKTPLSQREKAFIAGIDGNLITKQFLVIELISEEEEPRISPEISDANFEILTIFLKPYYVEDYPQEIGKILQKKQEQFLKAIENPIKRQPENILAARLALKIQTLIEPIQSILDEDKKVINDKIMHQKQELEKLFQVNLKESLKKAMLTINDDKDKFFKKVKLDVNLAKGNILDSFSKHSIIYQIQEFVDNLEPVVIKRDGQFYIQLAPGDNATDQDINQDLINFCLDWIEAWANQEWNKIINSYNSGGVKGLITRSKSTFNLIPSILDKTSFPRTQTVDIRSNLMMSFAGINCEVRHKQNSMLTYLMKEIRTNLMQYMMMLTLLLALVGVQGGKKQIFDNLSGLFKSYPLLLGGVIFAVFFLLMNAYRSDNQAKLDEAGEKLKKELASYYQSLSKSLLEKIIQEFNMALDYESKKIDDTIAEIQSNYNEYILETEKTQVRLQAKLEQCKEKEKNIDKEIAEFQKLIR